jgi:hypothetical protein
MFPWCVIEWLEDGGTNVWGPYSTQGLAEQWSTDARKETGLAYTVHELKEPYVPK